MRNYSISLVRGYGVTRRKNIINIKMLCRAVYISTRLTESCFIILCKYTCLSSKPKLIKTRSVPKPNSRI